MTPFSWFFFRHADQAIRLGGNGQGRFPPQTIFTPTHLHTSMGTPINNKKTLDQRVRDLEQIAKYHKMSLEVLSSHLQTTRLSLKELVSIAIRMAGEIEALEAKRG